MPTKSRSLTSSAARPTEDETRAVVRGSLTMWTLQSPPRRGRLDRRLGIVPVARHQDHSMPAWLFSVDSRLQSSSRLKPLAAADARPTAREWLFLISAGVIAACAATFLSFSLRIPGHAILRPTLPMTLGLALVPRRGGGAVMSGAAGLTWLVIRSLAPGAGPGLGALTSLMLLGPIFDFALTISRKRRSVWMPFALGGLATNLVAFAIKGGAKAAGAGLGGSRPLAGWFSTAAVTYAVCGLVSGLVCAALLFHHSPQNAETDS